MRPPTISTTLQEVGLFPTLVYFYLWAVKGLFVLFLAGFMTIVMACLWLVLCTNFVLFMECLKECFRDCLD